MKAASLLAQLRDKGISVSAEAGRLIIDAPAAVVTPQLRANLVKHKAELIAALENANGSVNENPQVDVARREIARLLAIAYRRWRTIWRVGQDRHAASGKSELANSPETSVHGVVP